MRDLRGEPRRGDTVASVVTALREAILAGVLPAGDWLREDDLASALGVSRTPVREAFRTLDEEGLVERIANRGCVVARMSLDEVVALYAVRETLEGLAARLAAMRVSPELIAALDDLHRRMADAAEREPAMLPALNLDFHRTIANAARNPYLDRFLAHIANDLRRLTPSTFTYGTRAHEAQAEHRRLIDAIGSGDPDRAEECARAHMRNARDVRFAQMRP